MRKFNRKFDWKLDMNRMFGFAFLFVWIVLVLLNFALPKADFSTEENRVLTRLGARPFLHPPEKGARDG